MSSAGAAAQPAGRAGWAAGALLAVVVALDVVTGEDTVLLPLLVAVPLVAAIACSPRVVAIFGAVAFLAAVPLGAADSIFGDERHAVYLVVVAVATAVGVAVARAQFRLAEVREAESTAYRRIELLDRSARLTAAPMDFEARLRELARLVVPDVADLAIVDLVTPDGRLEGIVAHAADPEIAVLVERTRISAPIDAAGEHPVAVALRTGEPQLREALDAEQLRLYATGPEHLELMQRLAYRSGVVAPLVARGRTFGVLSVLRLGDPVPFAEADRALIGDLAARAALAVDNARLLEERAAAESQLRGIIANLAEAVTITSADGGLVYINEAAAELFGYGTAEQALAVPLEQMFAEFELLGEDGGPLDPARLPGRQALAGEEPVPLTLKRRHVATGGERWLVIKASAVLDVATGRPSMAVNVIEDITAERRAHETATFLSEATKVLASSLDFERTLAAVAQSAVPKIADWCAVDLVDASGRVSHVALAHVEPAKEAVAVELRERYPPDEAATRGGPEVRRTGRSELHATIDLALLESSAIDARHLELLRALDITSVLIVPMTSGERTIGTISFMTTGGRRRLAESDRALGEELGRRAGIAVENALVHRERSRIAATLQRSLLPPRLPVVPGLSIAARFRAAGEANQVGGDFYDLFPVPEGWMVVIGDVTGKGPAAAAITSLARYTIRTAAMYEPDPAAVMSRLNEVLLADEEGWQMCTAACLLIRPGAGGRTHVALVCAGHPPPYLLRAGGELEELCRPGPLLGAFAAAAWEPTDVELAEDDAMVLYTDGVTDAWGEDGRFGQARLESVLREAIGSNADAIAERLDGALAAFQTGPQRDDIALLVLRAAERGADPETTVVAGSSPVPA